MARSHFGSEQGVIMDRGNVSALIFALMTSVGLFVGNLPAARAATLPPAAENEIKAVFLLHFSKFVEWPAGAFAARSAPLVICVLGDDPFGPFLEGLVHNESVEGHPIAVERYQLAGNLGRCHILFVGRSSETEQRKILDQARGKHILTVSDNEEFTRRGGVIGIVKVNGKVKLQVNRASAERADLRISSRLLRLADEGG